jgi:hypothetical protein
MSRPARFRPVYVAPLAIGLLSAAGLFAALLGDGWWDALAWLGLGLPVALSLWGLRQL